ncbi:hypothetical protein PtB15_5B825 [Puccinia triticina]|nr:hypothetical protein PtB15_5B825 [Puccinia triticina]
MFNGVIAIKDRFIEPLEAPPGLIEDVEQVKYSLALVTLVGQMPVWRPFQANS